MTDRINKPKVFLSHSSLDKAFIEKLANDLRKCQVEYWLDTEEIRDGRSWLKMIFEDGIPTCDAVIVYLTEHSLLSKMVEKELDATVVEQLTKGGITLLPYVSQQALRDRLRVDIRTLHCREWNDANYREMLPSVVAEIWRSYLERTVEIARLQESNRRLELELELKTLQERYDSSVFTPKEEREFEYIFKGLDTQISIPFGLYEKEDDDESCVGVVILSVSFLYVLLGIIVAGHSHFDINEIKFMLLKDEVKNESVPGHPEIRAGFGETDEDYVACDRSTELHTYGLIERTSTTREIWQAQFEFTNKMYRFKYWLDFRNFKPDSTINRVIKLRGGLIA